MANKKSHNKGYTPNNNKNNTNTNNNSSGYYDAQKPKNYTLQAQQNTIANSSFGSNNTFGTSSSVFGTTSNKPATSFGASSFGTTSFAPSNNNIGGFGSSTFGSSSFNSSRSGSGFGNSTTNSSTSVPGSGGFGSSSFASLTKQSTTSGFGQSSFASIGASSTNSGFGTNNNNGGVFNSSSGGGFGSFSSGSQFGNPSTSSGFGSFANSIVGTNNSVAGTGGFTQVATMSLPQSNPSLPKSTVGFNQPSLNPTNNSLNSSTFTKTSTATTSTLKSNVTGTGGFVSQIIPQPNTAPKFDPSIKSDKYSNTFTKVTVQKSAAPMSAALDAKETMTVVKDKTLIEQLTDKFNDLFHITNDNLVNEKLINNYFGQLTNDDKHAFGASTFHIGKIPEVPPSEEFCK
ncbi:predicted protein [Naegleria gruberi]|uniref:Predicted protein n=1 Tax=Naegleria gruberi TaxID=5762 RepID=D2UXU7_NAEGR|nr:uncharacterized protein NAEGRDRAFT_61247 [Naegleria gruberi]EFC50691.1 predicted protein [Naegleria gruberi]|eukprot:XP_002683435.1 predicted protein [Naegleria gruberi strain NEG-M]